MYVAIRDLPIRRGDSGGWSFDRLCLIEFSLQTCDFGFEGGNLVTDLVFPILQVNNEP